jgi:hypothetical protein
MPNPAHQISHVVAPHAEQFRDTLVVSSHATRALDEAHAGEPCGEVEFLWWHG